MNYWNHRTLVVHPSFEELSDFMLSLPQRFEQHEGVLIHDGRNKLCRLTYGGRDFVVKSFRRPIFVNRMVYGLLRPSKALRSYRNALKLEAIGVGTPQAVGYLNIRSGLLFDRSYFVTLASACTHRYEELLLRHFDCQTEVLKAVARTTARLHEHHMAHLDYGRANILFEPLPDGSVKVEIVDLNRMYFGPLDMKAGCKNLERLPASPAMHRILADEYARVRGFDPQQCYELMRAYRSVQPGQMEGEVE